MTDRMLWREHERMTTGASALHGKSPVEILEEMESLRDDPAALMLREREALRAEISAGFRGYVFARGPHPRVVRSRIEGALGSFCPQIIGSVRGETVWVSERLADEVLGRHRAGLAWVEEAAGGLSLSAWYAGLRGEPDGQCVADTLARIVGFLVSEGMTWRAITATAYCLAKALSPELIGNMPLADIATLSGDGGGRATPSARIKRLYNRRLDRAGALGCQVHFQKSTSASAVYAKAQAGNGNRKNHRGGGIRRNLTK